MGHLEGKTHLLSSVQTKETWSSPCKTLNEVLKHLEYCHTNPMHKSFLFTDHFSLETTVKSDLTGYHQQAPSYLKRWFTGTLAHLHFSEWQNNDRPQLQFRKRIPASFAPPPLPPPSIWIPEITPTPFPLSISTCWIDPSSIMLLQSTSVSAQSSFFRIQPHSTEQTSCLQLPQLSSYLNPSLKRQWTAPQRRETLKDNGTSQVRSNLGLNSLRHKGMPSVHLQTLGDLLNALWCRPIKNKSTVNTSVFVVIASICIYWRCRYLNFKYSKKTGSKEFYCIEQTPLDSSYMKFFYSHKKPSWALIICSLLYSQYS